MIVTA